MNPRKRQEVYIQEKMSDEERNKGERARGWRGRGLLSWRPGWPGAGGRGEGSAGSSTPLCVKAAAAGAGVSSGLAGDPVVGGVRQGTAGGPKSKGLHCGGRCERRCPRHRKRLSL